MDDVTVGARGHDGRPARVIGGVEIADNLNAVGSHVVLVFNDVHAALGGSVGGNDDAVFLVAGDGAETGLFVFDTTTKRNPLIVHGVIGADASTAVAKAVFGSHGVSEVDFAVGPNDGPGTRTGIRLPVVGRVVELAIGTGHVRLALHVLEALHASGNLHGSDFVLSVVFRHCSHL